MYVGPCEYRFKLVYIWDLRISAVRFMLEKYRKINEKIRQNSNNIIIVVVESEYKKCVLISISDF